MEHEPRTIDAIRRMKAGCMREKDIAMSVGLSVKQVRWVCWRRGYKKPNSARLELPIGPELMAAFRAEASRRGVGFERFMREMLRIIVADNLFTAILDDGK